LVPFTYSRKLIFSLSLVRQGDVMEPAQLQLALNVVTITAVASLSGYCYLLKKENRKLAANREAPRPEAVLPAEAALDIAELDVRTLASARRARWVKGLASSISQ
jgi:hypothetical protein